MVKAIAKVKINGINIGGAWTPPYRIDISKALKPGNNEIEIGTFRINRTCDL